MFARALFAHVQESVAEEFLLTGPLFEKVATGAGQLVSGGATTALPSAIQTDFPSASHAVLPVFTEDGQVAFGTLQSPPAATQPPTVSVFFTSVVPFTFVQE
jgi:hypothetical protein